MNTTSIGQKAELAVCNFLKGEGYKILDTNWRTRLCEIDIVAKKKNIIYFCEVKFRRSERQGSPLEYITSAKLKQIKFAAQIWCSEQDWNGDYRILAAGVRLNNGEFEVAETLEVI